MNDLVLELMEIHHEVLKIVPREKQRYLDAEINWSAKAICILGARGVGKTTLICQALMREYSADKALYFSADNIIVQNAGLFQVARAFFKYGGEALFIDEVHKYPNWSIEIKNIIDTYKDKQIVFSGSSSIELHKSKGDLSRRVVYYELRGLSFREYLSFNDVLDVPAMPLPALLNQHVELARQCEGIQPLMHFVQYLQKGYFPFYLENEDDYLLKLHNVIEKILYEDIATVEHLKQSSIVNLRKILYLVATSKGLVPNMDKISRDLGMTKSIVYDSFDYLERSGLTLSLSADAMGAKQTRKPAKVLLNNSNLSYAIFGHLKRDSEIGTLREIFFANQLSAGHRCNTAPQGDFIVDSRWVFEVGGPQKSFSQLKGVDESFVAADGIEIGMGKKIPLYLFGFLY